MGKTSIAWTEHTWNPVRGCSRVSEGCKNCYAERIAARFSGDKSTTGTVKPGPFWGFAKTAVNGRPAWTGKVELIPSMLDIPLRRRKPTTYFVNSMSDLFHETLLWSDILGVFDVMREATWHTFQVLTKRASVMAEFVKYYYGTIRTENPLPNVHLGVSVEDRKNRDRIDHLRATPAAVRFVSFEPLLEDLGELDLHAIDLAI